MPAETRGDKRELLTDLIDKSMVMVTLDARHEGVNVPSGLLADPGLRLNLSSRFGTSFELADDGVYTTLSFGGVPFACVLPWDSIYMFFVHTSGESYVFPGDVPTDVPTEIGAALAALAAGPRGAGPSAGKPTLAVVPTASDDAPAPDVAPAPDPDTTPEPPRSPPRRDHLRVVK